MSNEVSLSRPNYSEGYADATVAACGLIAQEALAVGSVDAEELALKAIQKIAEAAAS